MSTPTTPPETTASETAHADVTDAPIDLDRLDALSATRNYRLGRPERVTLTPDGERVLFLRSEARDPTRTLFVADTQTAAERCSVTAGALLSGAEETLSVEERARRERLRLSARGIASFTLSPSGDEALVPLSGKLFLVNTATCASRELPLSEGPAPLDPRFSPDGKRLAFVRDGALVVMDLERRTERTVVRAENDHVRWGEAEFVAQEEMDRMEGYWWSPDAASLLVERADTSHVETFYIADPTHPERSPDGFPYPRAGTANADVSLFVFDVRSSQRTAVRWDRAAFPYVAKVVWQTGAQPLVLVQNRTQTHELLLAVDPRTGATRTLLEERDEAWLNIDPTMPRVLPDGSFLWSTERRGAWQVEHRAADGSLVRELTPPEFGYRKVIAVDTTSNRHTLYVQASADSTEAHLYSVVLDGSSAPMRLSIEAGEHEMQRAARADVWVDEYETTEGLRAARIHRGETLVEAPLADHAEAPPELPRVAVERVTVGGREHAAIIVRPRDFDAQKRYPVLASVYGGPHYATVHAVRSRYFMQQWFADHGFIVVLFDGRGTPYKGREFERATSRDLISAPLADWREALSALAAREPAIDLGRAGVYGWSFGGYFTLHALLRAGDVFRAGVAGAPVADWRDYDTHYTERYMGLPAEQTAAYDRTSALTYAASLERPLLLIHGTADDNVYFLHSLRFLDALMRSGRSCEFLPLAGQTHMVTEPALVRRMNERMVRFFRRELGAPSANEHP